MEASSSSALLAGESNWWPQRQAVQPRATGLTTAPIPWPTTWAAPQNGAISSTIGTFGDFGFDATQSTLYNDYPWWPQPGFCTPAGTSIDYLTGGSLWVGGLLGGDTLVSEGSYLFSSIVHYVEFAPSGYARTGGGSVQPCAGLADSTLRAECSDTIQTGLYYPNPQYGETHRPLHVSVINRASVWTAPSANRCILFDLTITNIGSQVIRSGYLGLDLYPWVAGPLTVMNYVGDDFTGSMRDLGIGYAIDNDGDPVKGRYPADTSPTGALGWKFLKSSFVPRDTTYMWTAFSDTLSWQPFRKQHPADKRGNDAGRYANLSSKEWDYDQVLMSTIGSDDSVWAQPDPIVLSQTWSGGGVWVTSSLGPFNLLPDSSVRIVFSLFAADSVHRDPFIMDFLPLAPDLYRQDLNLESVVRTSEIADSLAGIITAPNAPVTGARVILSTADSVVVAWDPWVFSNTDGYNLYLTPIPDSAFPVPGVIPPWIQVTQPQIYKAIGRVPRITLSGIDPRHAYSFQIANRVGSNSGMISWPISIKLNNAPAAPLVSDTLAFIRGDSISISWRQPSGSSVDHYNLYKFADTVSAQARYLPFYSEFQQTVSPKSSYSVAGRNYFFYAMTRYQTLPGSALSFTDTARSGEVYVITAVDSAGYESNFSHPILVLDARRSRDVLVMTNSGSTNFVLRDSLSSFYSSVLKGLSFDFYSFVDSMQGTRCPDGSPACLNVDDLMPYKMVIIDDGLADGVLAMRYENGDGPFSRYLESGGTIAYFGSFVNMRYNPLQITSQPQEYPAGNTFVSRYFGIDSLFFVGLTYYSRLASPYDDTLFGFTGAAGVMPGTVPIYVDSARYPYDSRLRLYWPAPTPPSVSTFVPNARGHVTHCYSSSDLTGSMNARQPVGISTQNGVWQTFLYGFHLWYMNPVEARRLVDWMLGSSPTAVRNSDLKGLPRSFALDQNYPNPFNPTTTIPYSLPERSRAAIEIFNVLGQRVRTLVNETQAAGSYRIVWDGRTDAGTELATGIYLCRLQAGSHIQARKMLLLR